jgi:molybdopterin converting factor small subunit
MQRQGGRVKVLLYGRLADSIGRKIELETPEECSVADLRRRLAESHPDAADSLSRSRALVAGTAVADDRRIRADEGVEFLPPVSGG